VKPSTSTQALAQEELKKEQEEFLENKDGAQLQTDARYERINEYQSYVNVFNLYFI